MTTTETLTRILDEAKAGSLRCHRLGVVESDYRTRCEQEMAAIPETIAALKIVAWVSVVNPPGARSYFYDAKKAMHVAHEVDGCGCVFDKWAPSLIQLADALSPNPEMRDGGKGS